MGQTEKLNKKRTKNKPRSMMNLVQSGFTSSSTCQPIFLIIPTLIIHHFKIFETGPINSRVGAFLDVFSTTTKR